jgi:transposase
MRKRVHRMGLRRSRYMGEPRTHLQHVATAAAINLCRLYDWLTGVSPHSTPLSHFERFMKQAA